MRDALGLAVVGDEEGLGHAAVIHPADGGLVGGEIDDGAFLGREGLLHRRALS